MKPLDHKYT